MPRPLTRRSFLGQASCASLGGTSILSTLLNLRMAGAAAAQGLPQDTSDYRALVCLFLAGGQDSFNMLVPRGTSEHAAYASIRGGVHTDSNLDGLALDKATLLALPDAAYAPQPLGLHPNLVGLHQLFTQGKVALVANVGTLVERTDKAAYNNASAKLPRGLYSHSDQQDQWQTSVPTERSTIGWFGRAADLLHAGNDDDRIAMNLSLSGNNILQSGTSLIPYSITSTGSPAVTGFNRTTIGNTSATAARTAAIDNLVAQNYANLLDDTFANNLGSAIESSEIFTAAVGGIVISTPFPGDADYDGGPGYNPAIDPARSLAAQLKMVVRTIAAHQNLGHRRQTFFVNFGGWDMHDEVIDTQASLLDIVDRCLVSYYTALEEIGATNDTTLFTASDFGRTLTSNGDGSDHAWGGNHFVLGGSVLGGLVYGSYPTSLALNGPDIVSNRAYVLPTLSVDEYFAELALWFGVAPGELATVLPRINEFYTPGLSRPVGFMPA